MLPYRPNVSMLLFNSEWNLFLGARSDNPKEWQFPQGGVEDNDEKASVIRELEEELGVLAKDLKIITKCEHIHSYDFTVTPEPYKHKWRGQEQSYWVVEFKGLDASINLQTDHPEFIEWKWTRAEEVKLHVPSYRYEGYEKALDEFLNLRDYYTASR
jgi:putative (di)nucleoside polyphosphate hydrolase